MASYGPSFLTPFYGPSTKLAGHENKKRGSITCHMDQANEANMMSIIYGFIVTGFVPRL